MESRNSVYRVGSSSTIQTKWIIWRSSSNYEGVNHEN